MGLVASQLLPSLCKHLDRAGPRGASVNSELAGYRLWLPGIMETHRVDSSSSSSLRCVTQALTFRVLFVKWQ